LGDDLVRSASYEAWGGELMADERRRSLLRDEINARLNTLGDEDLVDFGWEEFADFNAGPVTRENLQNDLLAADQQIKDQVLLSKAARRRIRRFIVTKYLTDRSGGAEHAPAQ
jgi:hypothetical protein